MSGLGAREQALECYDRGQAATGRDQPTAVSMAVRYGFVPEDTGWSAQQCVKIVGVVLVAKGDSLGDSSACMRGGWLSSCAELRRTRTCIKLPWQRTMLYIPYQFTKSTIHKHEARGHGVAALGCKTHGSLGTCQREAS